VLNTTEGTAKREDSNIHPLYALYDKNPVFTTAQAGALCRSRGSKAQAETKSARKSLSGKRL